MESPRNVTVVCYLETAGKVLMLHRNKKKNDVNGGKWIGVGGHVEDGESPEEALVREVREETGYRLEGFRYRGIYTFCYDHEPAMYMFVFTSNHFSGKQIICDEGDLEWIGRDQIHNLDLWPADHLLHRMLESREDFFAIKAVYQGDDLLECFLDGKKLEVDFHAPN